MFEREQEEFEKRRKSLEEAQAKLEAEKRVMEREHAAQVSLKSYWKILIKSISFLGTAITRKLETNSCSAKTERARIAA